MHTHRKNAGLTVRDCFLLQSEFEKHAALLFPFPATVRLYSRFGDEATPEHDQWPSFLTRNHQEEGLPAESLGCFDGQVCCPLELVDEGEAYLLFSGNDHALLKKISRDWLLTFQRQVHDLLCVVLKGYRDPATGLYNSRALHASLERLWASGSDRSDLTLYLIHLAFVRRSITGAFHRLQYFADLLATIDNQGLFYLGQGVYALLLKTADHARQRTLAHRLQKFLRREKLQRVHIAFGDYASLAAPHGQDKTPEDSPLDRIVQALALAERRGPFGICDVRVLDGQAMHPFSMPPRAVLRKLQRLWRGLDRFFLALFVSGEGEGRQEDLAAVLTRLAPAHLEKMKCIALSEHEIFVLVPEMSTGQAEQGIIALHHALNAENKKYSAPVATGYCAYPDVDQCSKIETVRRCYKALMHGRFYGPDALVCFDHVSLNVSGDWYFDQGDFRQAVREYAQGLKRMPGEKNLLNSLGVALIEMKQTARAMATFEQVLKQDPDDHMALVNLGYACLQKGWRDRALMFFEKAHAVQYHAGIDGVDVLRHLSRLYIFFERFSDALIILERWQQCAGSEQDFLFHQLLGRAYFETGSMGLAMQALQRALRIHPRDAESMSLLGLLYIRENEGIDAGESLLKNALALDSRQAVYWYRYGAALCHLKRYDEALAAVRKSLRLQKSSLDARLLLVEILARQGDLQSARRRLVSLLRQNALPGRHKERAEKLFSDFFEKSKKET